MSLAREITRTREKILYSADVHLTTRPRAFRHPARLVNQVGGGVVVTLIRPTVAAIHGNAPRCMSRYSRHALASLGAHGPSASSAQAAKRISAAASVSATCTIRCAAGTCMRV